MRKVITYSTLGDNMKEVYSSASTWGELQSALLEAGIRFEGMRVMTNPGQVTLESLQAELPEGEFQLFIMPQKVKSGYDDEYEEEDDEYEEDDQDDIIKWSDVDWKIEDPQGWSFISERDKGIAYLKRAAFLLEESTKALGAGAVPTAAGGNPSDPILDQLRVQAAELQRNTNMFS